MRDANHWPDFFAQVPRVVVRDPLARLLGSVEGGLIEYRYEDAVALAGHSCPTIAAAYWLTVCALHALYRGDTPVRGGIRVGVRDLAHEGGAGVQAAVISLLTGAAPASGFRGIAGKHRRADLLEFGVRIPAAFAFTRLDTGEAVYAQAQLTSVAAHPDCQPLLRDCLTGIADEAETSRLGELWQARVKSLLLDYGDDHDVFQVWPVLGERVI